MNPMENHESSSEKPALNEWIQSIVNIVLSYYANLISHPFKSGLVYFLAGLLPALFVGWILFPVALYSKQVQPVNFSHAIHASEEITEGDTELERCLFCHAIREDGSFAGIPKLATCMECHDDPESPLGEEPEEERFLKEYVAEEKEVPWLVYSKQPDCVYFSHIAHVKMGKMECLTCHGDHGENEHLPLYEENRLTGISRDIWGRNIAGIKFNTWDRMKMDDCAECHTKMGHEEDNACFVCHK
jgi:hypothetical protein